MAHFLHRTTKRLEISVSTPLVLDPNKIKNPDLTGLFDFRTRTILVPKHFWKIVGDVVSEMSPGEKATVRAARLAARKTLKKSLIDKKTNRELLPAAFNRASAVQGDFYTAAFTAMRGAIDAGEALKVLVDAATTIAEVDAVDDNR
jgi:DNA/RNA endonuclease G (NUC1)